jgi:hypothetical protein
MPAAVKYIRTAGYALPGDGGGKLYKRAGVTGAGVGKDQSADGSWWETAENILDLRMIGGDPSGGVEATALITAAFGSFDRVKLAAGIWKVGTIAIPAGKSLLTEGAATILQQKSGTAVGTRVITIGSSNVTIGDMTIRGNIATDTDEQNHGILIQGAADISNIRIGNVIGENLRGDVVCVAGLATAKVNDVTIGNVTGNNVLRNVLTITGGQNIRVGHISGSAYGLYVWDIEPNPNSQPTKEVWIASAKGVSAGIAGPLTAPIVENVRIGMLDVSPAHATDSTPAYGHRAATVVNGMWFRNCREVTIDYFRARGFDNHAATYIYNVGEMRGENLNFGFLDLDNCSTVDTTYNAYLLFPNVKSLKISGGRVVLSAASKSLILGGTMTVPWIESLTINGTVINISKNGFFSRIQIDNATFDTYAFKSCMGGEVINSDITLGRLAGSCHKMAFRSVNAICATLIFNSTFDDHFVERCTFNSAFVPYGMYASGYLNAWRAGVMYIWANTSNGKLYFKSTTAPTSDTDGTEVGTQT